MGLDMEKLKNDFITELMNGDYDTDIMPNNEVDYQSVQNEDFEAFKGYLNSNDAKKLCNEIFIN